MTVRQQQIEPRESPPAVDLPQGVCDFLFQYRLHQLLNLRARPLFERGDPLLLAEKTPACVMADQKG